MEIVRALDEMRARAAVWRAEGRRIALVPTMGFLHRGHVSLLDEGRRLSDVLVLSIFVNPTQFGPGEDLARYPRDEAGDLAKASAAGVDVAFLPEAGAMYPEGYQTYVEVRGLERGLCGDRRPGHFIGVATVVLKLFHLVTPHLALFGEKDFQQLQLLRRMARDLGVGVEVVGMPIVREPDGLALSSRNSYLSTEQRRQALALSRALGEAAQAFARGERRQETLLGEAHAILRAEPGVRVDYLELRDAETLEPIAGGVVRPAVMVVAAFVGATRLIDNQQLRP